MSSWPLKIAQLKLLCYSFTDERPGGFRLFPLVIIHGLFTLFNQSHFSPARRRLVERRAVMRPRDRETGSDVMGWRADELQRVASEHAKRASI